eukprot:scaffold59595_cov30-Phaeocystis_antarctica.AAC.1
MTPVARGTSHSRTCDTTGGGAGGARGAGRAGTGLRQGSRSTGGVAAAPGRSLGRTWIGLGW